MRSYFVYVVELAPRPGEPRRRRPEIYVGSSAFPPRQKLRMHHISAKGSRHVRKRGVRLLPGLYAGIGPFRNRASAQAAERSLARRLEKRGYRVQGACSRSRECWL